MPREDGEGSGIDLLFTMGRRLGLMQLAKQGSEIEQVVGATVVMVPGPVLWPDCRVRVLKG